jgi:hypothetical protein
MSAELLDAAREYAIAEDRYHAACHRLAIERGKENVPSEEWDDTVRAACSAVNAAQWKLTGLCSRLFPQTEREAAWKEYSEHFWPTHVTSQAAPPAPSADNLLSEGD